MMFKNNLEQNSGDSSINLQAGRDINQYGISYLDVKEIALDVFKANFYELAKGANEVALERAERITNDFIEKLKNEDPQVLKSLQEPDMQYALFTAQKEHARSGDEDLANVLVDILVERAKVPERSLMQVVLNESLEAVSKLTNSQLNILSIVFILKYSVNSNVNSIDSLSRYLEKNIIPFTENITKKQSYYQHLEYTGCASISLAESQLSDLLKSKYTGIFLKGFKRSYLIQEFGEEVLKSCFDNSLIIPSLHDDSLFQFNALTSEYFEQAILKVTNNQFLKDKIKDMYQENLMTTEEGNDFLRKICPPIDILIDHWTNSEMRKVNLTSVGIALAHANLRKNIEDEYDLSIWIE